MSYLTDEEKSIVKKVGEKEWKTDWLMITPNNLLKTYLRKTFGEEMVPVNEEKNLKTWDELRLSLARDVFKIVDKDFVLPTAIEKIEERERGIKK